MIYQIYYAGMGPGTPNAAMSIGVNPQVSFLFDPANTDYQKFKTDVLDGDTLEDPDGVAMTQEEADAFIATFP